MRRGSRVGVILLLALGVLAVPLQAQSSGDEPPGRERGFRLGQNYPNPFNPETKIPFTLPPELFENGQKPVVTIRIYNILQQLVAIPVALNHPEGNGVKVDRLEYHSPGPAEAFWDGRDQNGNKVASGVYILQMDVNGRKKTIRMYVAK